MVKRRSRITVSRSAPMRKWVWARFTAGQTLAAGQVAQFDLMDDFNTAYGADLLGATVMRIRGIVSCESTNVGQQLVMGAQVSPQSDPLTIDETQSPIQSPFADWMMLEPFVTSGSAAQNDTSARLVDSQAARKLEELQETLYLWVATAAGNSAGVNWFTYLSIGLKLP